MKRWKPFSSFAVLLVLLVPGSMTAEEKRGTGGRSPEASFQIFRDGLLHIGEGTADARSGGEIERWLGTGILVDDRCTLATTRPVLEGANREALVARFQHPGDLTMAFTRAVKVVHEEEGDNLVFLRIQTPGDRPCSSGSLRPFPLAAGSPGFDPMGERVLVAGYPSLDSKRSLDIPVLRQGIVSCTEMTWGGQPMILLDLDDLARLAGSPVLLEGTGEVIGLAVGPGPGQGDLPLEWAVPISPRDLRAAEKE